MAARKSIRDAGLSSIASEEYIMENGQLIKTEKEPEPKADTSDASTLSPVSVPTDGSESRSLPKNTTATTLSGSRRIWKSVELEELQSKAGLVAGALADFQGAKGKVVRKEVTYTAPSGRVCKAIKLFLIVEDADLVAVKTPDGTDFNLVAAQDEPA